MQAKPEEKIKTAGAESERDLRLGVENESLDSEQRESLLMELAGLISARGGSGEIAWLVSAAHSLAGSNKLGLARILRRLLDTIAASDDRAHSCELTATEQVLAWAEKERKAFLRARLQLRLASLVFDRGEARRSRELLEPILAEARTADDRPLLIEGHLLDSRLQAAARNWPRAKAALTACRAAAASVYVAPALQAEIETTAGTLHLSERDLAVAYSYFFEGFEAFHQAGLRARAAAGFQYLVLCRIMMGALDEALTLIAGRYGQIYAKEGDTAPALLAILEAYRTRDLAVLSAALDTHRAAVEADRIIAAQVDLLCDQLLEKNIEKLIAPYSRVELAYLASRLGVGVDRTERKICEMILDAKLKGSIDQESGILILHEQSAPNQLFQSSLEIFKNIDSAVDSLFDRAQKLNA